MSMDEEFKINKMPTIKNKKDVEQLFEPGNFLYSIMKDCKNLIRELKKSKDYKNKDFNNSNAIINEIAKLEWAYIPHEDVSIHDWERAKEWYETCGLPKFETEDKDNPNDMITSSTQAERIEASTINIRNFLAVNHTIGNMITAKKNWNPGRCYDGVSATNDNIFNKLITINEYWNNTDSDRISNVEICKAYYDCSSKEIKNFINTFYFQDCFNADNTLKDFVIFDKEICSQWKKADWNKWLNNITKIIIQRGYRMQKKYKEPEFTSDQQGELQTIFDYFEFKDINVI